MLYSTCSVVVRHCFLQRKKKVIIIFHSSKNACLMILHTWYKQNFLFNKFFMFYKFIFGLDRFIRDKMNQLAADHISVPVCPLVRVLAPRVNGCNYRGTGPVTPSDLIRGNVTNEGSGHGRDTGERVSRYSIHVWILHIKFWVDRNMF